MDNVGSATVRIGKEEMTVKPTVIPVPDDNPNNDFDKPITFKSLTVYTSKEEMDRVAKLLKTMDPEKLVRVVVSPKDGTESTAGTRAGKQSETMTVRELLQQLTR